MALFNLHRIEPLAYFGTRTLYSCITVDGAGAFGVGSVGAADEDPAAAAATVAEEDDEGAEGADDDDDELVTALGLPENWYSIEINNLINVHVEVNH